MKSALETYGGRRWVTSIGILVTATTLLCFGLITANVWQEVIVYVYGIFAGANVVQRGVEATKEVKISKQASE